jgi:Spy/CpxP family protein refolding chaperone
MRKIGVSDEQVQNIEKIFQDHRLQLIDLHAACEKQEAILEPLIEAGQPDESQVDAQIDNVAQARANLEKSNTRMLLAIRRVLTVEQWKKLKDLRGVGRFQARSRFGPPAARPRGE